MLELGAGAILVLLGRQGQRVPIEGHVAEDAPGGPINGYAHLAKSFRNVPNVRLAPHNSSAEAQSS